jgi:hypothetical protein
MKGYFGGFWTCLKLEDFKTPEKVGGEEALIPLKNEATIKIERPHKMQGGNRMSKEVSERELSLTAIEIANCYMAILNQSEREYCPKLSEY